MINAPTLSHLKKGNTKSTFHCFEILLHLILFHQISSLYDTGQLNIMCEVDSVVVLGSWVALVNQKWCGTKSCRG